MNYLSGPPHTQSMSSMIRPTEENQIRIVLLDAHGLFRTSLARYLGSETGFEIAGECGTSAEALEILRRSTVDIILLDVENAGKEFIFAARETGYQGNFLVVAGAPDARNSALALKHGASGIFLKSDPPGRLVQAIRLVADGGVWVDQKVIQLIADQLIDGSPPWDDQETAGALEARERTVLLGILAGLSNKKIGANMGISESSVKNVVQRLFGKAGVKTRTQLVRVALEGSLGMTRQPISRQFKKNPAQTPV